MWLRRVAKYFNLLPCPRCGEGDGDGCGLLCPECRAALPLLPVDAPHCPGCGGVPDGFLAMCRACMSCEDRPWQDAATVMEYRDEGALFMKRFKSGHAPELARPLGFLAAEKIRKLDWHADLVVPVPLRFFRRWRRLYNQSALFGERVGAELGIPCRDLLVKLPGGEKQAGLSRAKRLKNRLRFKVRDPEALRGKNVILVDDIFTTGSTLAAAAKALRSAGPALIYVLSGARTPLIYTRSVPRRKPAPTASGMERLSSKCSSQLKSSSSAAATTPSAPPARSSQE